MSISLPKLKAIILYFANFTDTKFLGKVKLMKLFYFLDFLHVKKYGSPITYDTYVNLEHGPIPSGIKNLIDTAADDIDNSRIADIIDFQKIEDINMFRILPKRKFTKEDEIYFSESELDILNKVCQRFGTVNTKTIEDESHKETPWRETRFLQAIPYELAAKDPDCVVSEEEITLLLGI